MDEIVINGEGHGERIADASGVTFNPAVDQCIARVRNGELLGGVILNGYTKASINTHMAGFIDNFASREFIQSVFHYCFEQLKVRKVFGQVPSSNTKALQIDLKLGFLPVHRVKDVFEDGDLLVLEMTREDCRWLRKGFRPRNLRYGGQARDDHVPPQRLGGMSSRS
jgi:hypothetical protein